MSVMCELLVVLLVACGIAACTSHLQLCISHGFLRKRETVHSLDGLKRGADFVANLKQRTVQITMKISEVNTKTLLPMVI